MTYTTETNHTQTVTGNRDFSVGFPFLATADIKVQLNGTTKTLTNDYTIVQSGANTTINFNTAPADNATIRIFRDTDIEAIEATYTAGSSIRSSDLNTNNTQLLYAAQEFGTLKSDNSVSFTLGDKGDISVNSSSDWTLNNNSVEIANMANNSVGTSELVNDAVTDIKVANDAIATASLKDNAVTIAKMADNSVNTSEIVNSAVTTDKLANGAVTAAKVSAPGGFNPVGTVIWYAGSSAPSGYLKCNGDSIANGSGTTQGVTANFSALYAVVGSTVPDLRGEFIRGWDDGRGTDSGRSIRTSQGDANHSHSHGISVSVSDSGHKHWISSATKDDGNMTGTGSNTQDYGLFADNGSYSADDLDRSTGRYNKTNTTGIGVSASIANEGGESRPRNIALLACIKY